MQSVRFAKLYASNKTNYLLIKSNSTTMAGGSSISIKSSSFADGQRIPTEYTMYGSNTKPDLSWSNVQPDAKSLLLLVHDPDAVQVAGKYGSIGLCIILARARLV